MALTVTITGGENIEQGGQVTLTAVVTDASGNTPPGTLQYAWSASRGSFVGATDGASAVYHADFTDTNAVDVTITCDVTRPANAMPTSSGPSLTALAEIGVTGILVNMFLTELGAVATNTNNVLYNASTGTLDAGSDQRLSSNVNIFQLRWDNTNNNFVLNNDDTGNIGSFFLGNTNQSLYLIFEDGTYVELTSTHFGNGTSRGPTWARWQVTDTNILALLNALSTTSNLVVGVADAGAIGWNTDTGSDTETFTAAVPIPRSIAMVATQNIVIDTDYCLTVAITGNPTTVEVTGDMEYFNYDWRPDDNEVKIAGHPEKLLNNKNWYIEANYSSGDPLERDITFNVVPAAPVFGTLPDLHLYRDVDINIEIPITNPPSEVIADTLLLGLGLEKIETGAKIDGVIPADANFTVAMGNIAIEAPHLGETVMSSVPYTIEPGAPPVLGQIKQTPKGNFAVAEFVDVQHAIEYEWGIDEGAGVDFISWNRFGPNRPVIDLENISVTLGHLSATVTFPHVAGATRYEYLHSGNWREFVAAPVSNMITTIIPDLEDGETYQVYFRVSSPWVGVPVPVTIRGGRLAYAVQHDGANSTCYIFHTAVSRNGIATAEKTFLLPTGNADPIGIAIDGTTAYCLDKADTLIYVFSTETAQGQRASLIKTINLPSTNNSLWDIAIYDGILYILQWHTNNGNRALYTINANTANGQTGTIINSYGFPNSLFFHSNQTPAIKMSVTDDSIYMVGPKSGFRIPDDFAVFPRVPLDYNNVSSIPITKIAVSANDGRGMSIVGETRYIADGVDDKLYIDAVGDVGLPDADLKNVFSLPPGLSDIRGLDIPV